MGRTFSIHFLAVAVLLFRDSHHVGEPILLRHLLTSKHRLVGFADGRLPNDPDLRGGGCVLPSALPQPASGLEVSSFRWYGN